MSVAGNGVATGPTYQESAGAAYSELIEGQIKQEVERKQSIEARGLAVVTSTGVIAGVALALAPLLSAALSTASQSATSAPALALLPPPAIALMVLGGASFAVAIFCGVWANAPTVYEVAETNALERLTEERFWGAPRSLGSRRAAEVRVAELRKARTANSRKSSRLIVAFIAQGVGIFCIGAVALFAFVSATTR